MALPNLPFPVADLGWDKFDEVREAAKLDRDECITVMKLVCGDPPPGFDARSCTLAPSKDLGEQDSNPKPSKRRAQPKAKATGKAKAKSQAKKSKPKAKASQVKKHGQKAQVKAKAKAKSKVKPSKKAPEPEPTDDEHEEAEESEMEDDEEVEPIPMKRPAARTHEEAPKAKVAAAPKVEPARVKKAPIVIPSVAMGPGERVNNPGGEALQPKEEIASQAPSQPPAERQATPSAHGVDLNSGAPLKRLRTDQFGDSQWPPESNS